jgi:ABC-type glycerol-3-phosphate transport system permease component
MVAPRRPAPAKESFALGAAHHFLVRLRLPQSWIPPALGLQFFRGTYDTQMHLLMAASTLVLLPVIVLFFFAQKQFVRSIVLTGIKG